MWLCDFYHKSHKKKGGGGGLYKGPGDRLGFEDDLLFTFNAVTYLFFYLFFFLFFFSLI